MAGWLLGKTEIPLSVALAKADGTGNIGSAGIVLSVLAMYLILTVFSFSIGAGALLDVPELRTPLLRRTFPPSSAPRYKE